MTIDPKDTALVITDPQNDFLSPDGATWGLGGNSVTEQPVGSYDGWIIGGGEDVSLVVDAGVRTLVVNVDRGLVSEDAEPVVLDRLASEALGLPTATVEPPAP